MVLRGTLGRRLRAVLKPLVSRLDSRWGQPIDQAWGSIRRLEHRADALEASTTRLFQRTDRQDEGEGAAVAPLLLDAVATQHGALRAAARRDREVWEAIEANGRRLGEAQHRIELVRREMLFELRYGREAGPSRSAVAVEPKILNEAKVEAMRSQLRLNVGSGSFSVEGYVNIDARALDGVDVVADVAELPFDDGTVGEVYSAHVLEHFPEEELRRRVLPHWAAKLRPGGTVRAIVPDALSMIDAFSKGALAFEDLREVTFGGQDYEGDFHFTMFSVESLTALLEGAGFVEVDVIDVGRRNGLCLEMELVARKPGDRRSPTPV